MILLHFLAQHLRTITVGCIVLAGSWACSTPGRGLLAGKTAHEQYASKIDNAGLKATALGQSWFAAANKGLTQPLGIRLPYRESGYFDASQPAAAGFRFTARRGDRVLIQLIKKPAANFALFLDLYEPQANSAPRLLASADTTSQLKYEVKKEGDYLLRLQPELLASGEYTLEIRTGPSLEFPVATTGRPRISSFWGDARDKGARSHEGIDIFGPFRTPVLAAADGTVTSVGNNNLGGKVVFMRPKGQEYVLYYAHLDSQMVQTGDRVRTGDTLGLMGNTGNARTTPPHLHFGIYTGGGAIDPLPFVETNRPEPAAVVADLKEPQTFRRSARNTPVYASPDKKGTRVQQLPAGTLLKLLAGTGSWYKVQLPDGQEGFIAGNDVQNIARPLRSYKPDSVKALLDRPNALAASKGSIAAYDMVLVLGSFNNYNYVSVNSEEGWVVK